MLRATEAPDTTNDVADIILARPVNVALRLFAFPHAGGGHNAFGDWPAGLPDDVEIVSYTLPGRAGRPDAPPYRQWRRLIDDLVDLVVRHDDGAPFVFFGHSFGALVAFNVAGQLVRGRHRAPEMLFVSAHRAPGRPPDRRLHDLPTEEFVIPLREWGLVPADLLADGELLRLLLPALRADLALDEDFECDGERLAVPCVVYGGADDQSVRPADLPAWRAHIEDDTPFDVEILPGDHFYTISARIELLASVRGHLDRVRARVGPSIAVAGPPYPTPRLGVWARFEAQVAAHPDALALVDGARRWTCRQLRDDVVALAAELAGLGIGRGDVVGLLLPHSAAYCIGLLTCFGIGAPACLLERNWPASLLGRFLDSAGVRMVVTTDELVGLLPPAVRASGRFLVVGRQRADPVQTPDLPDLRDVAPSDVALISMTSGTSGVPKAVRNTHLGCLYSFDARFDRYPYRDSSCDGLNVFLGWECLRPLLCGRPGVIIPDEDVVDPVRLVAAIATGGITRIVITPSLLETVLDHPGVGPALAERLGRMEIVFLMGEVVPARVVDKAAALLPAQVRLVNAYSTWESLDVCYADLLPRASAPAGSSSCAPVGRILPGSAAILLGDDGRPVPYGGVGELCVAGPGVALGYLDDPARTAERFVPCPTPLADSAFADAVWYRTGDRARFRPDGELEILGRVGDIVKVRGFKVSLRAVESILAAEPGVARVIVRRAPDERTGLLAYVLADHGTPSATVLARLRARARRDLPEYARPRHVIGLATLPISHGDARKLDLTALPPPPDTATPPAALTTTERHIARVWCDVLGVGSVEPDDNFFDLGGDSLSAARLSGLLTERFGIALPVVDVLRYSTLRAMAERCTGGRPADRPRPHGTAPRSGTAKLAVVGMAGRFPGAPSVDAFWANLRDGTDSLTTFTPDRLRGKGVRDDIVTHPKWVPAAQLVADADRFDAGFWGIGQREAVLMDPQHRVFVEIAWAALEQAGYARRDNPYRDRTGVFAACGIDGYLIHHLAGGGLTEPLDPAGLFLTEIGNEKDYIATRVAYLLDLGGPALTVTSACSSALAAVAQAAQAIMTGQCDMAVAGASSINFPNFGYRYEDGLVGSADGRVRPFDDAASGTLFGDSVGAVILKRLDDAIADDDHVWAVLTGFGVSNDGRAKAGYTAPSAGAQARCVSDAIAMAGIGAEQVSYVECHATATHLGDAVEMSGLLEAFAEHRRGPAWRAGSCAIGSVKGNIGHANCAAGITGLIKTVLCLANRTLVPTVHYRTLNPKLVDLVDCDDSPFTVQDTCREWTVSDPAVQLPRRAGVSSFGIGGTNAHVILEEPPARTRAAEPESPRSLHLVTVSARSDTALRRNAAAVTRFVAGLPAAEVGTAVRSLHLRRAAHVIRASAVIAPGVDGGLDALGGATVAFCFAGQGSQTAGMARGLYRGRADGGRFRRHFDAVCASLAPHLSCDPAPLILGADDVSVLRPTTTQCGLFAVEYAIARTLLDLGVSPVAVAGHSIGEYAAAVVAGLLTLDEASALVAVRACATEELRPDGGMLGVVGDEDRLADWLSDRADLWLAARNAPGRMVLSGTVTALRAAAAALPGLGFTCRPVPVSHPFHSDLMAPVAARLNAAAAGLPARASVVPIASNRTGDWFDARFRPADYWGEHVRSTVRWRDDVNTLLAWEPDVVLEIGPGAVLTGLNRKCLADRETPVAIATMPDARDPDADDEAGLLAAIGTLWCHGVDLDFAAFHDGAPAPALPHLPTYAFDRTSYWTRPDASPYVDRAATITERTDRTSDLLVRFVAKPAARMTLYCFPYAGGNSGAFRSWAHAAPPWLDVVAVELPRRHGVADTVVLAELAAAIRADAGSRPVAFCGLSFGAALLMDLLGGPLVEWDGAGRVVAVSVVGRAPIAPSGMSTSDCPVESYLMTPDELRDDAEWRQRVLPVLRDDLAFDARSAARVLDRRARVIDCPLQVHCGTDDPSFPGTSAAEWAAVTGSPIVDVCTHAGGHDFMLRHRERILDQLVTFLDRVDPTGVPDNGRLHEISWVPVAGGGTGSDAVRWIDLDERGPVASARFLRSALSGPTSAAALLCRLPADRTPSQHCAVFLELLTSLAHAEARGELIIVLPAGDSSGLVAGMTRSFAQEEPGLTVRRVHLADWPADVGRRMGSLLDRVRRHSTEVDLLLRDGHLLARRLLPAALPELPAGTLGTPGGGYLITGGSGGIGRIVTDWLIQHQGVDPARVIVSGRTAPRDLRAGVRFVGMDLARPTDPAACAGRTGPLAGIVHLAGTLDDGVLRNLTADRFPAVLAPKLALPWLAELGGAAGARWIIASSSTSALLGAPGQANYAAANGWLDAHAMWSTSDRDCPVVVAIDWGTWHATGMAARTARAADAARSAGETPLSPGTALNLFGRIVAAVLAGTVVGRNFAVCDVNWPASPWAGTPLVAELPVSNIHGANSIHEISVIGGTGSIRDDDSINVSPNAHDINNISDVDNIHAIDSVHEFLNGYVHEWDESRRLVDLGLDSLDFARMRGDFARRFGKDVPLAVIAQPGQSLGELRSLLSEY